jgi:DNA-binding NtrC family response regulator
VGSKAKVRGGANEPLLSRFDIRERLESRVAEVKMQPGFSFLINKRKSRGTGVTKPVIIIAEIDEGQRKNLKWRLVHHGLEVAEASGSDDAFWALHCRSPDLVIVGSSGDPSHNGLNLAVEVRERDRTIPIILIVQRSSEERALSALRIGVNDYFKQPFSFEQLIASINRNLPHTTPRFSKEPHGRLPDRSKVKPMIGESQPMQEIKAHLLKIAATDSTVLITGETGTGKELAAELIHRNSPRYKKPFVCVNCAALPDSLLESELFGHERGAFTGAIALKKGKFELANGGTIFLDEIGNMHPYAQAKILRTIERQEVDRLGGTGVIPLDVRTIAASNQDPEQLIAEGKFREDLYYRLNVARLHMPPLRQRKEDILALLEHTMRDLHRRTGLVVEGFHEEALIALLLYHWPGNVRELNNLLEATFINLPSQKIAFSDLPKPFQEQFKEAGELPESERDRLLATLFATNWNKSKTAQRLHWSRMTLYRKMAKYHIRTRQAA